MGAGRGVQKRSQAFFVQRKAAAAAAASKQRQATQVLTKLVVTAALMGIALAPLMGSADGGKVEKSHAATGAQSRTQSQLRTSSSRAAVGTIATRKKHKSKYIRYSGPAFPTSYDYDPSPVFSSCDYGSAAGAFSTTLNYGSPGIPYHRFQDTMYRLHASARTRLYKRVGFDGALAKINTLCEIRDSYQSAEPNTPGVLGYTIFFKRQRVRHAQAFFSSHSAAKIFFSVGN